jgi:uncharacterized protein
VTGPLNLRRNRNTPPVADPERHPSFGEGLRLFNEGHHWHAHEALEPLWMGLEGDDKLFVQGIIMAAAMLHQYGRRVAKGVANHWANVELRLGMHRPEKWGVDVDGLLRQLERYKVAAEAGDWSLQPGAVQVRRVKA